MVFFVQIRRAIGDFGVLLSIVIVTAIAVTIFDTVYLQVLCLSYKFNVSRINKEIFQRIDMPHYFTFTNAPKRGHGYLVSLGLPADRWWAAGVALVPAVLVYILLFVETEITQ